MAASSGDRIVLVAVDSSDNAKEAFHCEYFGMRRIVEDNKLGRHRYRLRLGDYNLKSRGAIANGEHWSDHVIGVSANVAMETFSL